MQTTSDRTLQCHGQQRRVHPSRVGRAESHAELVFTSCLWWRDGVSIFRKKSGSVGKSLGEKCSTVLMEVMANESSWQRQGNLQCSKAPHHGQDQAALLAAPMQKMWWPCLHLLTV